jgi:hypothetical protein
LPFSDEGLGDFQHAHPLPLSRKKGEQNIVDEDLLKKNHVRDFLYDMGTIKDFDKPCHPPKDRFVGGKRCFFGAQPN